jgi:uncharacterized pyridoxal phosphate-containing UPF0001 family protein
MTLSVINSKIKQAEKSAGRANGSTQLIAVSKVQPNERVLNVLEHGSYSILAKIKFKKQMANGQCFVKIFQTLKVHLIGPLQSNKVKQAVAIFDAIHTVDRLKLAHKLSSEVQAQGKAPEMFVQINTGEEKQKSGYSAK